MQVILLKKTELRLRTARDKITRYGNTALHAAVAENRCLFVKGLVEEGFMNEEDLAIQDYFGYTALRYGALAGTLELVKFMIERNNDLVM